MLTLDAVQEFVADALVDADPSDNALAARAVWLSLHGVEQPLPPALETLTAMAQFAFRGYWRTCRIDIPGERQGSFLCDDPADALRLARLVHPDAHLIEP